MFYKMLRRDILYTAVTRAKAQVFLVGDKRSVYRAVHNTESEQRNTMLGDRILQEYRLLTEGRQGRRPEAGNNDDGYEQLAINF